MGVDNSHFSYLMPKNYCQLCFVGSHQRKNMSLGHVGRRFKFVGRCQVQHGWRLWSSNYQKTICLFSANLPCPSQLASFELPNYLNHLSYQVVATLESSVGRISICPSIPTPANTGGEHCTPQKGHAALTHLLFTMVFQVL